MTPTVVIVIVAVFVLANIVLARRALRRFFYPIPRAFPPSSGESETVEALLARLDHILRERAPAVADALRPGLSDQQIDELEQRYHCRLSNDLRALYRWHDSVPQDAFLIGLLPGHRFVPLGEAMELRVGMVRQTKSAPMVQKWIAHLIAGHRLGWLTVMDDGCGDGYFFDPARGRQDGSFFFCFTEDRTYHYFRTLANFLEAVIECYESGVYRMNPRDELDEDHEKSHALWPRFASMP